MTPTKTIPEGEYNQEKRNCPICAVNKGYCGGHSADEKIVHSRMEDIKENQKHMSNPKVFSPTPLKWEKEFDETCGRLPYVQRDGTRTYPAVHEKQKDFIRSLLRSELKAFVEEILVECQKDVDFGAQHQQIVSTKGQAKCLELLTKLGEI